MSNSRKPGTPKKKPTGDYPIGFCQPPQNSRFKKGVSGNPSGGRKGPPPPHEAVIKVARQPMKVKFGDKIAHITKHEAILQKLAERCMTGDAKATKLFLDYYNKACVEAEAYNAKAMTQTHEEPFSWSKEQEILLAELRQLEIDEKDVER